MFLENQNSKQIEKYYELLKIVGGLSNLFSDSTVPYLYYRAAENIFCKAFEADNLSRSDCSADARINLLGVGLKTFLNGNGKSYQKVAEFNKERELYNNTNNIDHIVKTVSDLRNKRITSTQRIHKLDDIIYHCVSRTDNKFLIFEEKMDLININKINRISNKNNSITFEDGLNEYNFNLSKSTLLKRFYTPSQAKIVEIDIIKNPFDLLENLFKKYKEEIEAIEKEKTKYEFVILPLYSSRTGNVEERSGLNQWNANGRKRDEDEIYIPIPSWIHKTYFDFFPTVDENFNLILPNKEIISAKVCQSYSVMINNEKVNKGKSIMSNPNSALGKWLLRDILRIPYGKVVQTNDLYEIGIDSVEIKKIDNKNFEINFKKQGSFEEFWKIQKEKSLIMNKEEKLIKKEKAHLITLVLMALYFSMLEAFIPKPFPWMKLGLANISTIIAIRNFGSEMGMKVFILRVLIQAFVMGTFLTPTFAISLISGLISTLLMIFLFKYDKIFSVVAISGISAVAHNISQLIVVYFLMFRGINLYTRSTFIFILVFIVIGFCSGALLGYFVHKYDKKNNVSIQA